MPSPEMIQRYLAGEEILLPVARLAAEVQALREAVPAAPQAQMHLVVQLASPALIDTTSLVLRELAQTYPCRVLLLVLNPHTEAELSASVTSLLPADKGYAEQVLVLAGGASVADVPELARALLPPTSPVTYWFAQGIPAETPLLELLFEQDPRILFDSYAAEDLGVTLARAHALSENNKQICDLNWLRLAPWRVQLENALAQTEVAAALEAPAKVSCTVGGDVLDENQIDQPVLLLSWLALRFEWELIEAFDYAQGGFRSVWEKSGREFTVEITNARGAEKDLQTFTLTTPAQLTVQITRKPSATGLLLSSELARAGSGREAPQATTYAAATLAQLLSQEFQRTQKDEHWERTLALATKLI